MSGGLIFVEIYLLGVAMLIVFIVLILLAFGAWTYFIYNFFAYSRRVNAKFLRDRMEMYEREADSGYSKFYKFEYEFDGKTYICESVNSELSDVKYIEGESYKVWINPRKKNACLTQKWPNLLWFLFFFLLFILLLIAFFSNFPM